MKSLTVLLSFVVLLLTVGCVPSRQSDGAASVPPQNEGLAAEGKDGGTMLADVRLDGEGGK